MKEVKRMTLKQAGREDERMSCADRQLAKEGGRKRRTRRMAAAAQEEMRKGYMISTAAKQPVLSCPVLSCPVWPSLFIIRGEGACVKTRYVYSRQWLANSTVDSLQAV